MRYHEQIHNVHKSIEQYVRKTPVIESHYFSETTGSKIFFKCDNLQHTNSFKVRGAFNKISKIENKQNKIAIASSGGNHGMAVTYAAKQFNMKAVIVVPEFVPKYRIDKIKEIGAEVIVYGQTMDDLNTKVAEFTSDPNYIHIHPFDDDDVIAGQATVAYELLKEVPDLDILVASIGGGGLISGVSQYAKSFNPKIKIYGAQTIGADAMSKSIQADKLIAIPKITSSAISLGATKVSQKTFDIVRHNVEQIITVDDVQAARDLKAILDKEKLLVELASSCSVSAILSGKIPDIKDKSIGVILCGGNFSLDQLSDL